MTSYVLSIVDVTKTGHGEGARGTGKKRGAEKERGERRRSAGSGEGARGAEKERGKRRRSVGKGKLINGKQAENWK